jgi:hypothetical protein
MSNIASVILDERVRRMSLNEALFREVNERINDVNNGWSLTGDIEIVCECGDLGCTQLLRLRLAEYEHIRSDPTWFAVVAGHEVAMVEVVIARATGYNVVQKRVGVPADVARVTDQRR